MTYSRLVDTKTGFTVTEKFERFNQTHDVLIVRCGMKQFIQIVKRFFESYFTDLATFRKVEGFTHRDYALRNTAWHLC